MFRTSTQQIRQKIVDKQKRSRTAKRKARRQRRRSEARANWVCIACEEGASNELDDVLKTCQCGLLGRFHLKCLSGHLEANADAPCNRCRRKYRDPTGQNRIKRYKYAGPNFMDYILNTMLRQNPNYQNQPNMTGFFFLWCLILFLLIQYWFRRGGTHSAQRIPIISALLVFYFIYRCRVNYLQFIQIFYTTPHDVVRVTGMPDGRDVVIDVTMKRMQLRQEDNGFVDPGEEDEELGDGHQLQLENKQLTGAPGQFFIQHIAKDVQKNPNWIEDQYQDPDDEEVINPCHR